MVRYAYYDTPLGWVQVGCEADSLVSLRTCEGSGGDHSPSPLSDLAEQQLLEYFHRSRRSFDLPLAPKGTEFQRSVWNALLQIPYGETWSYLQLAQRIGNPRACRAVGAACGKNPIWILIPCHRVLGSSRSLTGYAGGLEMKRALLELEHR